MRDFYTRVILNRWFITGLGCLVAAGVVWYVGPLLGIGNTHPLETRLVRWIVVAAIFVLWVVMNLLRMLRASKQEKELTAGIAAAEPDPSETASAEEIALLQDRLKEALHNLKKAGKAGGAKRLSTLPWYMFIGPPGAGKTTALLNCGLKFPLSDKPGGAQALKGVGGTRNCDWWFTDEAVLIDTAGRYTTQDSQAAVDNAAWLGFLRMLKKHRRRQPLNGVLVAVSLSDLSLLTEEQRLTHARAIRRRVKELHDELGVRVPVYVLFTKADMIAGFVEFYDSLGREDREQVWGVTFPYDNAKDEDGAVAGFTPAFDTLVERLNDRMLERVNQETDPQRRRLIYGFPQQVASLRDIAGEFLTEAFRPSRLEPRALLRGIYFTSGTQDGTPIDRLLGTMVAEFGLPRQSVTAFSGQGRSYFLTRLIKEVVFGEAGLVGLDPKVEKRQKLIAYGSYAAAAVFLLALMGGWLVSYVNNRELIANVRAASVVYTNQVQEIAKRGPNDLDLAAVVPALDTLRGIPGGYDQRQKDVPLALELGLYQGEKLGQAAADAYVRALNGLLLPRMLGRLEVQIAQQMNNPDLLYPLLKAYLVLGRQGPLDKDLVMQWFAIDVAHSYPGEDQGPLREALLTHAEALMTQPLTQLALNTDLIVRAREVLNREPLAEYSYNRIIHSKKATSLPEWTVSDNAGPGAGRVFQLRSGKGLNSGVPGIYTWAGYHNTFLSLLPTITQDISEDSWVLGRPKRDVATTLRDTTKLRRDVMNLYLDDYARKWDALLADVAIKPFANLQQALDELSLLSAPASPLRDLLTNIDGQTQLSRASGTDQAVAAAQAKASKVGSKAAGLAKLEAQSGLSIKQVEATNLLGELFGNDPSGKPIDPASRVDDHFKALHEFLQPYQSGPSQMERMLKSLLEMYQNFNQVANAPNQGQALLNQLAGLGGAGGGGAAGAAQALKTMAQSPSIPKPVAAMLSSVASSGTQLASSGASQELADAWKSKILPLCQAAFNRYPMIAGSPDDVPVDDFANLLGPGGLMDQFFDQYLKRFVDTSSKPWKWVSADKVPLGLSPGSLQEFERADQIKKALFTPNGQVLVKFQLVPVSLDPSVAQISLDIAGTTMIFNHGPAEPARFAWPAANGSTLVRVTMTPTAGGNATVIEKDGPWALLRLLDAARIIPSGQPDKFRISFTGGGGAATFQLNANSVNNPFTLSALRSFRCPPKL